MINFGMNARWLELMPLYLPLFNELIRLSVSSRFAVMSSCSIWIYAIACYLAVCPSASRINDKTTNQRENETSLKRKKIKWLLFKRKLDESRSFLSRIELNVEAPLKYCLKLRTMVNLWPANCFRIQRTVTLFYNAKRLTKFIFLRLREKALPSSGLNVELP